MEWIEKRGYDCEGPVLNYLAVVNDRIVCLIDAPVQEGAVPIYGVLFPGFDADADNAQFVTLEAAKVFAETELKELLG